MNVHAGVMTDEAIFGWGRVGESPAAPGAYWPASMMERVVGFIAADYRRPIGPIVTALVLAVGAALESRNTAGPFGPDLALTVGLLATAPLAVIRRYPAAAIATVLAANACFVLVGRLSWSVAAVIGWIGALAVAPILLPRRQAARAVALTEIAVLLGAADLNGNVSPWDATTAEALAVIAAWGAGEMVRARRQAAAERAAAAAQVRRLSERAVVARERASIARELHDVVAHHVSMIAVRAATAPYSLPELPESGRAVLAEIAEESRTALTELRVVLGVLRSRDGAADAAPQPQIADIDCLISRMTSAGMNVTMTMTGSVRQLPASIELCCYRVVQEALTNAGRYARGSKVRVELSFAVDAVAATVENSPAPAAQAGQAGQAARASVAKADEVGYGLTGLRERVAMLGGEFQAGPGSDGGFAVQALLPMQVSPSPGADDQDAAGAVQAGGAR
jgi:signal transduction histidine kinase